MEHPTDITMLEMLAGHIPDPQKQQWLEHIENCTPCRSRWREFSQTWTALDAFAIDTSSHNLTDRILSAVSQSAKSPWIFPANQLIKIAASIIVAAALGHIAGKLSAQKPEEYWQNNAAQVLYLDTLLPGSPTGWADPILAPDAEPEDETP